jgi:hypothetical protein
VHMTKLTFTLLAACGLTFLAPTRSYASLISGGSFDGSGDFNVGATFLNWNCNQPGDAACATAPANKGDFTVSMATGTFAQYLNTFGLVTDINNSSEPLNTPVSLPDFITFDLNGNETITLNLIPLGNDPTSADCVGLSHCTPENAALATAQNPLGLSAFNLDQNGTGVAASFGFMGTIVDSSGATAPISGTFTSQFNNATPEEALAQFFAAGSNGLNKTYSSEISFTVVPEPMTFSLIGTGLLGIGLLGRRLRRS